VDSRFRGNDNKKGDLCNLWFLQNKNTFLEDKEGVWNSEPSSYLSGAEAVSALTELAPFRQPELSRLLRCHRAGPSTSRDKIGKRI
jgi:hypothetical protein